VKTLPVLIAAWFALTVALMVWAGRADQAHWRETPQMRVCERRASFIALVAEARAVVHKGTVKLA
jgi:hypothetical protein